jgi:hypothetical protein
MFTTSFWLAVLACFSAILGAYMSAWPPQTKRAKITLVCIFGGLGAIGVILVVVQTNQQAKNERENAEAQQRAERSQQELKATLNRGVDETNKLKEGLAELKEILSQPDSAEKAQEQIDKLLGHSVLIPANRPTPPNPCTSHGEKIPPDAVLLMLGGFASYTSSKSVAIKARGEDVISFSRDRAGILVSARVYSPTNNVLAQITDNELFVNPSNVFKASRPDWHTLIIRDNVSEVFRVSFVNRNAVKISGVLATSSGPIVLGEGEIRIGGLVMSDACDGESKGSIVIH